jgi:hypothetical protein
MMFSPCPSIFLCRLKMAALKKLQIQVFPKLLHRLLLRWQTLPPGALTSHGTAAAQVGTFPARP